MGPDDGVVERRSPDEAFEALAHETRVRIVEALDDAGEPLSFGDLRDRVGVDDPGRFNYHLGKLTDTFVRDASGEKRPDSSLDRRDGYRLTAAGRRVVGAVRSGAYTRAFEAEPVPTGGACQVCDGGLQTQFQGDRVRVTCRECGFDVTTPDVPAGVLEDWPREEIPGVVDRWLKRLDASAAYGFCPSCDGRVDRAVCLPGEADAPDWFGGHRSVALQVSACRRCGRAWHAVVEHAVVTHPAVVAFHYDHGVDVRETPFWSLDWVARRLATVAGEDPLRVVVPVTVESETRRFTFDRDLRVVEKRRAGGGK